MIAARGSALLVFSAEGALLRLREPGGDVFFVPEGEVFYYLVSRRSDCAESELGEDSGGAPKPGWGSREARRAAQRCRSPGG